jgi:hypothetical protein
MGSTVADAQPTDHESVDSMKNALDLSAQLQRHPWLLVGGSILCGYLVGKGLTKPTAPEPTAAVNGDPNGAGCAEPTSAVNDWYASFAPEINQLQRLAVGIALGSAREVIVAETPAPAADCLRAIIDEVTRKFGGIVIPKASSAREPTANGHVNLPE